MEISDRAPVLDVRTAVRTVRALLVEDSEADALLLERQLRKGGYEVEAERVDTAAAMRAVLERGRWDIVIADYVMPSFSGLEALRMVQKEGLDVPFIMVSGRMGEHVAVEVMKAGASDYIVKGNLSRLVPAVERELREAAQRKLRRRADVERKLILDAAADGIFGIDLECVITFTNPAAAKMFGVTMGELLGKSAHDIMRWVEADGTTHLPEECPVCAAVGRGEAYSASDRWSKKRDGTPFPLDFICTPMFEDGKLIGAVALVRDITQRKSAETALLEAHAKVEDAYRRERRISTRFQSALLPRAEVCIPGLLIAHSFRAAMAEADVGGDFYNFFSLDDARLGIVIGDVAGKGLDAAVTGATVQHSLAALAQYERGSPAAILDMVRALFSKSPEPSSMFTLFFGILDLEAGLLSYASAGHEPPVLWSARMKGFRRLELDGPAIVGGLQGSHLTREAPFEEGDLLVLFTDGLSEARSGSSLFGTDGIMELISGHSAEDPAALIERLYLGALRQGGGRLQDDIAVLALRRLDAGGRCGCTFVEPPAPCGEGS